MPETSFSPQRLAAAYLANMRVPANHIAQGGSLILCCALDGVDDAGTPLAGVRGWFIEADAGRVTPHRILPDDLYEAMNTDAQTGAKLPPEPHVRYL